MADKKKSLISKIRNSEKLSFFEKFFPLFIPLHIIGNFLKVKDLYSTYKKQLVTDIGSGKSLSLFNEIFSILHPITFTKGLCLRIKNHRKKFLNSVEQNILNGEPKLSILEQFREIFDITCWPTVYKSYKQKLLPFKKKEPCSETSKPSKKDKRASFVKKEKAKPKSSKSKIIPFRAKEKDTDRCA